MTEIVTLSIITELREKVDRLRGDIARSKFICRIIEDAIQKHTKRNLVPTTGQSLQRSGQPAGKKFIHGDPTDA